jgi:hypothetical protein
MVRLKKHKSRISSNYLEHLAGTFDVVVISDGEQKFEIFVQFLTKHWNFRAGALLGLQLYEQLGQEESV